MEIWGLGHGAWGMGHWALGIGHWVWGKGKGYGSTSSPTGEKGKD